ncbi:hypothetical protein Psch_01361 [Pelotomaculum schinkii]|uniref:DUF2953 domain-containing protein n=1 Tax=Pelotomaculum schinkii TaxID=78350 RepID=A0A4Y7RG73_9FIRM|nr:DUF2953 domain-containing protein [Pelotomaculum schinkii]TEB07806.1 hypothetical protein Psch_01361 [Pelotomaculum schinkii]
MTPILVIMTAAAGMLVLLLIMPFDFTGRGEWGDIKYIEARLKWAGGLAAIGFAVREGSFNTTLSIGGLTLWRGGKKEKSLPRPGKQKTVKKKNDFNLRKTIELLSDGELFKAGIAFLRRLVRAFRLDMKLSGRYGADDPALTGLLAGLVALINGDRIKLKMQPVFTEAVFELRGALRSRVIPAELLGICLTLLWQKPVRRIWLSVIKNKMKFKKEAAQHV